MTERLRVTFNGREVGYAEGPDIVITDDGFAARLNDLGRAAVSIELPAGAGSPLVDGLTVRPK